MSVNLIVGDVVRVLYEDKFGGPLVGCITARYDKIDEATGLWHTFYKVSFSGDLVLEFEAKNVHPLNSWEKDAVSMPDDKFEGLRKWLSIQ